jgi:hypothetical protein
MPEFPTLEMAGRMVRNYRDDDFTLWIVEGNLRIGKSAYSVKNGLSVLDYFFGLPPIWDSIEPNMGWHPAEVVEKWLNVEEREPFFIWDDAGMWLFSLDWANPLMVAIQKYMNVIATDYNNLILTTPNAKWILSKIVAMPGSFRVKIVKRYSAVRDDEATKFARLGTGYQPWKSPDLKSHGVYKRFYDKFSCKLPDPLYKIYKPIRDEYAHLAKMEIKQQLRLRSTLGKLTNLKFEHRLRRLEADEDYAKFLFNGDLYCDSNY